MDLTAFAMSKMVTFLLVFARTGGLFIASPVFSNRNIVIPVKIVIALSLAFIFVPLIKTPVDTPDTFLLVALIIKEITVGFVMGFVASLTIAAIKMAGTLIDLSAGFGFAQMIDPLSQEHNSIIGQLLNLVATLMFLVCKAHYVVIQGLAESFRYLPLGNMIITPELTGNVVSMLGLIFLSAMKIAAPIIGVIFLTDIALGIVSRTVPQLNILNVGFSVKMVVCAVSLMIIFPVAITVMANLFGGIGKDFTVLVRMFANGTGG